MSESYPEFGTDWVQECKEIHYYDADAKPSGLLDAIAETALSMKEYEDHWPEFYVSLHLRDILVEYAQQTQYFGGHKWYEVKGFYEHSFNDLQIYDNEFYIDVDSVVAWYQFKGFVCVQFFTLSDMNATISGIGDNIHASDSCSMKAILEMTKDLVAKCSSYVLLDMYEKVAHAYVDHDFTIVFIGASFTLLCVCLMYILLDLFERCYFAYLSVANKSHAWHIIVTALGTKVPGSYLRKHMNVISASLFVIAGINDVFVLVMSDEASEKRSMYLVTTALILRFIMHIHSMRLLPGIGHFVITTFMMGNNLLHFSAVFTIVVFIFSAIFNMILTNPECPVENLAGFNDLFESMFSTFRLTFGHGDIDAFYSNIPAKVSYVMYIVIMGLLLMNLIIGIMSSTAMDVMQEPWRETMWHMEWLEEALSAEYTYTVLGLSCRCCCNCNYISHRKAGYVVERCGDGTFKMYLPVLNLPMLE